MFWPYHHAITQILAHRWRHGHGRAPALIAIHSFTPMLNGFRRPWQLGVLWNRDPRLALPVLARFRTDPELCVGDNEPYSGREVGFTMDTHGGAAGLPHVEIEIRQDLIADDAGCERWATVVGMLWRRYWPTRPFIESSITDSDDPNEWAPTLARGR